MGGKSQHIGGQFELMALPAYNQTCRCGPVRFKVICTLNRSNGVTFDQKYFKRTAAYTVLFLALGCVVCCASVEVYWEENFSKLVIQTISKQGFSHVSELRL
jgi:hypothetical protein